MRVFRLVVVMALSSGASVLAGQGEWTILANHRKISGTLLSASRVENGTVYASGGSNGLSMSTDFGESWHAISESSWDPNQLFLEGTRPEGVCARFGGSFARSTDRGTTWVDETVAGFPEIEWVTPDEGDPGAIYVHATRQLPCAGFFCPRPPARVPAVFRCEADAGPCSRLDNDWMPIYATTGEVALAFSVELAGGRLYRTDIDTTTFVGIEVSALDVIRFERDPGQPNRVFGLETSLGLFRSDDLGRTWTQIGDPAWFGLPSTMAVDPSRSAALFAAVDREVFLSEDAGATWEKLGGPMPDPAYGAPEGPIRSLAVSRDGSTVYAGAGVLYGFSLAETFRPRSSREKPPTQEIDSRDFPSPP
jgi:hypothetical protein